MKRTWLSTALGFVTLVAGCAPPVEVGNDATGGGGATQSSSSSTTSSSTGGATGGGAGGVGGSVDPGTPPDPGAPTPGDGPGAVFAVSKLFLGDQNRANHPDPNAWKAFGYNIDGQVTNCTGTQCSHITNHCRPAHQGSKSFVYPDGKHGIDNSFGANVLPIILGIQSDTTSVATQAIAAGKTTLLIEVETLGNGSIYGPLTSKTYLGAPLGARPHFDGSDVWPVQPESLTNPADVTSALSSFARSYVIGNTWVSGLGTIIVPLPIGKNGFDFPIKIDAAVASFVMSSDHTKATNGIISGVVDATMLGELIGAFVVGADPSACTGNTLRSVENQVLQAADIMKDGSPGTANDGCDGISIGLGFDASRVQLGTVGAPLPEGPGCPD